jgi:hypothetical protein
MQVKHPLQFVHLCAVMCGLRLSGCPTFPFAALA